ncbi:MAG: S9 family peptidase [Candidatus Omnitrophica bacterium]|nr:S9 family peptidase [Candidatus Omnitrophota bacterium]
MKPPLCKKVPYESVFHETTLSDAYAWLKDRESPEVLDYLKAENSYTDFIMKPTEVLQEKLYQEILSRIKETDLSVPVKMDDYYYYSRTEKGKQYSISCRKKGSLEAAEEILLDSNELAHGLEYFSLGSFNLSPDHQLLAYSTDTTGAEVYTLQVKNLITGELLTDKLENCATSVEWAADNQTLFYTTLDEAKRPCRLFKHRLGGLQSVDDLIFHEKDETFLLAIGQSKDRKYLFLESHSKTSSEVQFLPSNYPDSHFQIIHPRQPLLEYGAIHHGNRFFILTNENAVNFKLMQTSVERPEKENWKEVIGHRPGVKLEGAEAFENHLVVYEREEGLMKIRITDIHTQSFHYLDFPEPVYTAWGGSNPEFKSSKLRFGYTSLVTPSCVFDYDMNQRTRELKKQTEVLGGYDPSRYETKRIYAAAKDGTRIPVSLVYRKGIALDGNNPLFLYGYGSYGISIDPEFSSVRLSLLDRGFIFAIAHIRGGGDLGRPWYEDGKFLKKKNTFQDFIACAEHLIRESYTQSKKMVIYGGSAGGLLIGNVLNERPELFFAAIAKVPFVDIVNTMLDKSLPLTVGEYEEWGNPENKTFFDYMLSYSPYDHVKIQDYPHLLITTGLNDPRVQYWEPAKWTAKLRTLKTDSNLLLLKIEMGSGHGGPSGRYEHLKEIAFDYAFVLNRFGMTE